MRNEQHSGAPRRRPGVTMAAEVTKSVDLGKRGKATQTRGIHRLLDIRPFLEPHETVEYEIDGVNSDAAALPAVVRERRWRPRARAA